MGVLANAGQADAAQRCLRWRRKAGDFIVRVKEAMSPDKQYYTLLERYERGEKDTAFLRKMTLAAVDAYDKPTSAKASKDYLSQQKNLFSKGNLEFIGLVTESSKDPGFEILLHYAAQADAVLGAGKAEQKIEFIILKEEVYPAFHAKSGPSRRSKRAWRWPGATRRRPNTGEHLKRCRKVRRRGNNYPGWIRVFIFSSTSFLISCCWPASSME